MFIEFLSEHTWLGIVLALVALLLLLFTALKIDAYIKRQKMRKRRLARQQMTQSVDVPVKVFPKDPPLEKTEAIPDKTVKIATFSVKIPEEAPAEEAPLTFAAQTEPPPRPVKLSEPTQLLPVEDILAALRDEKEKTITISNNNHGKKNRDATTPQKREAHTTSPHRYSVGSAMHIGTRKYQQDSIFVSDPGEPSPDGMVLGVLCDGMGGMSNGEKASGLAVETMSNDFYALGPDSDIPAFFDGEVRKIDRLINETLSGDRQDGSAGTTMVAVALKKDQLYWVSVGDSRIYILRGQEMVQVTRDHNLHLLLTQRMNRGELSEQAVENHADKSALISYLGMDGLEMIDCNPQAFPLQCGDTVLLCSDGLTNSLSNAQIQKFIEDSGDNMLICSRMLTHKAFEYRKTANQDNTSVIVIRYKGL